MDATSCCRTIRRPCCVRPSGQSSPRRSATTSSRRRAPRCWAGRQGGRCGDRGGGRTPARESVDSTRPIRLGFTPDEEIGRGPEPLRRRAVRRRVRLHARRRRRRTAGDGELLGRRDGRVRSSASTRIPGTPRDGWSTRSRPPRASSIGCRTTACRRKRRTRYDGFVHPYQMEASVDRTSVRVLIRDFDTAKLAEKEALVEGIARTVGIGDGYVGRDRGARVLSQHARGPRSASRGRRACADGHQACGPSARRAADPRRNGWIAAVVHGPSHTQPLCRRAQLPLAAGVDVPSGSGESRRGHRAAGARLGDDA